MAEYIKFRVNSAKVGVTMAFLALLGGVADKARAATPRGVQASASTSPGVSTVIKLDKAFVKIENAVASLQQKLKTHYLTADKIEASFETIKKANKTFISIKKAESEFLKITDADLNFLKADGTAVNAQKLGDLAPSAFVQGNNTSVVSGALNNLSASPQQILSVAGGIIVVSVADTSGVPAGGPTLTIHNSSSTDLIGVLDPGNGQSVALNLKPNGDTTLPAVQDTAEVKIQIFPGGAFTNVVSILIGLTPNPANSQQIEAVAQAFTGGV
jgi:hypothetical protein